jgi:hypothetical protein
VGGCDLRAPAPTARPTPRRPMPAIPAPPPGFPSCPSDARDIPAAPATPAPVRPADAGRLGSRRGRDAPQGRPVAAVEHPGVGTPCPCSTRCACAHHSGQTVIRRAKRDRAYAHPPPTPYCPLARAGLRPSGGSSAPREIERTTHHTPRPPPTVSWRAGPVRG